MNDDNRLARPLGWWLKEADARIDETFDRALGHFGLDRRRWQILASVARGPMARTEVAAALSRFDDDVEIAEIIADLRQRGMVHGDGDDPLELTDRGTHTHQQAAQQIDVVRTRVGAALGDDGYRQLVALLAQLVDGLSSEPWHNGG